MSSENPKRMVLAQLAATARALGHELRLELLEHLGQGERSVEALAKRLDIPIANASQHLQALRRAGLVAARREGKYALYRLGDDAVVHLLGGLRQVAERSVAELGRLLADYFHDRDSLEPVSRRELLRRLKGGQVTVLDVRPEDEFAAGHLPGAVNIPLPKLKKRLSELPRDVEVVAYCRGPYCLLSFDAVAQLRKRGFRVHRLEDGYPEWKAAGLPIEPSARPRNR